MPFLFPLEIDQRLLFLRGQGAFLPERQHALHLPKPGLNGGAEPNVVGNHPIGNGGIQLAVVVHLHELVVLDAVDPGLHRVGNGFGRNRMHGARLAVTMGLVGNGAQFRNREGGPPVVGDVGAAPRTHDLDEVGPLLHQAAHGLPALGLPVRLLVPEVEMATRDRDGAPAHMQGGKPLEQIGTGAVLQIEGNPIARPQIPHGGDTGLQQVLIGVAHAAQQHQAVAVHVVDVVIGPRTAHALSRPIHEMGVGIDEAGQDAPIGKIEDAGVLGDGRRFAAVHPGDPVPFDPEAGAVVVDGSLGTEQARRANDGHFSSHNEFLPLRTGCLLRLARLPVSRPAGTRECPDPSRWNDRWPPCIRG